MFSKSKINEPAQKSADTSAATSETRQGQSQPESGAGEVKTQAPKAKPPASVLSSDLNVTGNLKTTGDIQVEGTIEGDIRAHLLTIGEGATVKGEVIADDVVINGRIVGRVRGLKVRLTSTARVEGDIIHKTIAIESGAHFEGSVQRQDDPLSTGKSGGKPAQAQGQAQQPQQQPAPKQQPDAKQQEPRPAQPKPAGSTQG